MPHACRWLMKSAPLIRYAFFIQLKCVEMFFWRIVMGALLLNGCTLFVVERALDIIEMECWHSPSAPASARQPAAATCKLPSSTFATNPPLFALRDTPQRNGALLESRVYFARLFSKNIMDMSKQSPENHPMSTLSLFGRGLMFLSNEGCGCSLCLRAGTMGPWALK